MSPDISTRCLQCGAAVRPDTLFCPECGRPANVDQRNTVATAGIGAGAVSQADGAGEMDDEQHEPVITRVKEEAVEPIEAPAETVKSPIVKPAETVAASAADPLAEHLAKLKDEAEVRTPDATVVGKPVVPVVTAAPQRRRRSPNPERTSKGRSVYSRFPVIRVPERVRGLGLDPGLRFVIVAGVLFLLSLAAYVLSRYLH